jgi:murein DD-endopeptidase MepM/ murein hydrolase activator NlpD
MNNIRLKIIYVTVAIIVLTGIPVKAVAAAPNLLPQDPKQIERAISDTLKAKIKRGAYFVLGIEAKLKNSRDELTLLRNNINLLEDRVNESNTKITDLKSQLDNLDRLIANNKEKTFAIAMQIRETQNGIAITGNKIKQKQEDLDNQVSALDQALVAYYMQDSVFFSQGGNPRLLAFLSSEESAGEILRENEYLFFLQNAGQELADKIRTIQANLDTYKMELKAKTERLQALQILAAGEQKDLIAAQESKQRLLEETQGKQMIYETLLSLSKQEQEQVSTQIAQLKENYAFFQTKLDELKANPLAPTVNMDDLIFEEEDDANLLKGDAPLAWPVSPALGLSAFYHDGAYQKAMGIQHNAIDIRLVQGSNVKSAASGVVSKVADNGFAYSYVIIAHPDSLLTLYGHLSQIFVKEGELVSEGQVIGLSGGMPGTKGAGWLTTGPHLHFEVFRNWQHVDPLEYLPLEYVPVSSLPEKYLDKITGNEVKVKR